LKPSPIYCSFPKFSRTYCDASHLL